MNKIIRNISAGLFAVVLASCCGQQCNTGINESDSQSVSNEETYTLDTDTSEVISLPAPDTTGGMPLMKALKNRCTTRAYTGESLSDQQVSNLLWAAGGVNREDGRLTSPTARNAQEIDIYVYTKAAVYLYQPSDHSLKRVLVGNNITAAGKQDFYKQAGLALTFVANYDKMENFDDWGKNFYGATDAGFVSQNVYLYCAQEDLGTVVCGMIDREAITNLLGIKNGFVVLSQAIGK